MKGKVEEVEKGKDENVFRSHRESMSPSSPSWFISYLMVKTHGERGKGYRIVKSETVVGPEREREESLEFRFGEYNLEDVKRGKDRKKDQDLITFIGERIQGEEREDTWVPSRTSREEHAGKKGVFSSKQTFIWDERTFFSALCLLYQCLLLQFCWVQFSWVQFHSSGTFSEDKNHVTKQFLSRITQGNILPDPSVQSLSLVGFFSSSYPPYTPALGADRPGLLQVTLSHGESWDGSTSFLPLVFFLFLISLSLSFFLVSSSRLDRVFFSISCSLFSLQRSIRTDKGEGSQFNPLPFLSLSLQCNLL